MSYEIMTKDFSTTSYLTLATQIGTYIAEQVPELSVIRTYTSGSNTKCPFLQWDGTKAGFGIYGYISSSSNPVNNSSNYIRLFIASGLTTSSSKQVYQGASSNSFNMNYATEMCNVAKVVKNGTYYAETTVSISKLSSGYIISIGEKCIYIGTYTSTIFGKCIVGFSISAGYNATAKGYFKGFATIGKTEPSNEGFNQYNYYDHSCIFSEDGSSYYNGQGITIVPDENVISDNNAILCPMYFVCKDAWIEPFVIPDLYYMIAKTYPNTYETAQVGDVIAYKVSSNNCVVV